MKKHSTLEFILIVLLLMVPALGTSVWAADENESRMNAETFKGLELRNIGPAFKSGRIADLIIHPEDESVWYVAVASRLANDYTRRRFCPCPFV